MPFRKGKTRERKQLITVYITIFPRGNEIGILFYPFDISKLLLLERYT